MKELPQRSIAEMRDLLDEVNSHLEGKTQPGTQYVLYAVGGIAMGHVFDHRLTQDIDVLETDLPKSLQKAIRSVAARHEMPDNWINNQVADMMDVDMPPDAFQTIYRNKNLHVYGATPDYLLALKLMSGRSKDLHDLVMLGEEVGATTPGELLAISDNVFSTSHRYPSERIFIESVCEDIAPIVQARIAGEDITADLDRLAAEYEGHSHVIEMESHSNFIPKTRFTASGRRRRRAKASGSSGGICGAKTKNGDACTHPKPKPGKRCAAGHRR